jgi:uncharacterized iron-regulated membrane protein
MSAVREGQRQTMAWLHGWTGLLLGHVLLIMCLAGTASVFKAEIGRWMRPETVASADPVQAIDAAARWLSRNAADSSGWYLTAPDARMNTVEAAYSDGAGYKYRALDPVTGAPVARETLGGEFFYRLHFELQLPFPWGRWLASLAGMTMLVALITGIIAHRRIFRDFFTFRPAKGQRSWLDGHNALGVLALPFHLMITFTGVMTLASLHMPWPLMANYGQDLTKLYAELTPGAPYRAASGTKAPLASIAPMLRAAQRRFGDVPIGHVYILNPGDKAATVGVYRSDAAQIGYLAGEMTFDGTTGQVLADWTETRPSIRTYDVLYGLHLARFAPGLTRWLYFLGGLMLSMAVATGLVLWIVKRRERAPLSLGNRLLERLNVGMVTGVPIGLVAILWANRLLPLGMTGRAEAEVSVALWSAGAALAAGLALKPAHAWPLLLGVLAIGCAGAPLIGGGPEWLVDAVSRGDAALIGGDLILFALALALAPPVLRMARRLRSGPAPLGRRQPA